MQALNYIMMLLGYSVLIGASASYILYTSSYSNSNGRLVTSFLGFGVGRLDKDQDQCQNVIEQWGNIGYKFYKTKNYAFAFYAPWSKF